MKSKNSEELEQKEEFCFKSYFLLPPASIFREPVLAPLLLNL